MPEEMKNELKSLADKVSKLNTTVEADIAYRRGLEIPTRMKEAEENITEITKTKASYVALYSGIAVICLVVTLIFTISKGMQP